ncbi:conserved hypothetical protein [Ricinus communis]|uniref:Uncharacterized protein n=1 Tax=Ricinus communis TaxID=3988 RepID=B9RPR5_RICCO|nr:conserved hypothetical protein [Ricinus communis]
MEDILTLMKCSKRPVKYYVTAQEKYLVEWSMCCLTVDVTSASIILTLDGKACADYLGWY